MRELFLHPHKVISLMPHEEPSIEVWIRYIVGDFWNTAVHIRWGLQKHAINWAIRYDEELPLISA